MSLQEEKMELKLPTVTPRRVTSDQLLEETAQGLAVMELAADSFRTGVPLLSGVEERAERYMQPESNKLFQSFDKARAYGFADTPCLLTPAEVYHMFAFVVSAWPPADYFGCVMPYGCSAVLQAAYARDKLEEGMTGRESVIHGPGHEIDYNERLPYGLAAGMTIPELCLLSGVKEQSIRNTLHADKSIPRQAVENSRQLEIPVKFAKEWLVGKGYYTEYEPPKSGKHYSVPEAGDGTFFNVGCRRTKGFTVGKKGAEKPYTNYAEALEALEDMPIPYWRRPSKTTGVAGIVKGVKWVSKSRKELGLD